MKKAFTLAEVLITLTIIGVIAALTIPNLMKNYQKHVWVTQLHKCYNRIVAGNTKILQDNVELPYYNEPEDEWNARIKVLNESFAEGSGGVFCKRRLWKQSLNCKYANYEFKTPSVKKLNGAADYWERTSTVNGSFLLYQQVFTYPDGSVIALMTQSNNSYFYSFGSYHYSFTVDVNGSKGPNQIGRDIFIFNGPSGNNNYVITPYGMGNPNDCATDKDGYTCAAKIMQDGWKMNY